MQRIHSGGLGISPILAEEVPLGAVHGYPLATNLTGVPHTPVPSYTPDRGTLPHLETRDYGGNSKKGPRVRDQGCPRKGLGTRGHEVPPC